jgi:hypothetical protein
MKNSNATSGIEPATFRLLAQYLDKLHHRVSPLYVGTMVKYCAGPGLGLYLWIETGFTDVYLYFLVFQKKWPGIASDYVIITAFSHTL